MIQKIKTLFAFVLFFISSLALFATFYTIYIWGDIYFEQIRVALDDGTAAVGDNIINSYVYFTLIPAAILTFVVILFVNSNRLLLILSFTFLLFSLYRTSFFEYLIHKYTYTDIYKTEYVNPKNITFKFPDKKQNLIILYLESMEKDYANLELVEKNLIPNLTKLAKEEISFDGYKQLLAHDYTIASIVAGNCAIPYKYAKVKSYDDFRNFLPSAVCFPDILKQNGYKNYFIQGSDLNFARKGLFFKTHGYDHVTGIFEFEKLYGVKLSEYQGTSWGYRDSIYYDIIKKQITDIASKKEPFVLTFLTLDTHEPDVYLDEKCIKTDQFEKDVIVCADKMVMEFVEWIKKQDFYKNTTVVIMGDHIATGRNKMYPQHKDRQIVNIIMNPYFDKPLNLNRKWTSVDIAPTILNSLGVEFADGKFGLGRSLYNTNKTLYEKYDKKFLTELLKSAKEYEEFNKITTTFKPKYNNYANFGTTIEGNENIKHYASFSDIVFSTIWLDTLSFTLPQNSGDILFDVNFKILFMEKNKRIIKVFANGTLIDTLIFSDKVSQPIQQQIKIPANLIKDDKKLKLDFRGDDLGIHATSISLGVLRFKIDNILN